MTIMAIFIIDDAQKDAAVALNGGGIELEPRPIDNGNFANSVGSGLGIGNILGKYEVPARILNDPDYTRWIPMFGALPIYTVETDMIFAPAVGF